VQKKRRGTEVPLSFGGVGLKLRSIGKGRRRKSAVPSYDMPHANRKT
jgi:hypothetical protein